MLAKTLGRGCAAMLLSLVGFATAYAAPTLVDAAQKGDLKAVKSLLRDGADINSAQADGMTALHWAVQRNDLDMVSALLAAHADYHIANRTGVRPLYLAAMNGNASSIARLLDAGEDANAVLTGEGET